MDCQMPEMDGYEATIAIRRLDSHQSKIVIIAMTANAMKEDRDRCLACGMDDYLSKPIRKEDLAQKLAEWECELFHNAIAFSETVSTSANHNEHLEFPELSSHTSTSLPLIDWTYIDSITDGDEDFKAELLQTFFESTSKILKKLEQAIAEKNCSEISRIAHLIKGSSANLGITSIAAIANDLEQLGRNQKLDNAESLLKEMQDIFLQIQD
jgi:CheY-like chemotaxis protein